jgi:hypothetical protein
MCGADYKVTCSESGESNAYQMATDARMHNLAQSLIVEAIV